MKASFLKIFKIVILLGTIGISLNILFGENTMIWVEKSLVSNSTTLTWYRINLNGYIQQLNTAITETTELQLKLPTIQWYKGENVILAIRVNVAVVVNWIIAVFNILIYPLKVGGYIMRFILALLGLNYSDPTSSIKWLGDMSNTLISLSINYINPY